MGQAQINVRTRACSRTSIARTRQAALTHNVRGKELSNTNPSKKLTVPTISGFHFWLLDYYTEYQTIVYSYCYMPRSAGATKRFRPDSRSPHAYSHIAYGKLYVESKVTVIVFRRRFVNTRVATVNRGEIVSMYAWL